METAVSESRSAVTTTPKPQQKQQLPLGDVIEYEDDDEEEEGKSSSNNREVGLSSTH